MYITTANGGGAVIGRRQANTYDIALRQFQNMCTDYSKCTIETRFGPTGTLVWFNEPKGT